MLWLQRLLLWGVGLTVISVAVSGVVAIGAAAVGDHTLLATAKWWGYGTLSVLLCLICVYIVRILWEDLR